MIFHGGDSNKEQVEFRGLRKQRKSFQLRKGHEIQEWTNMQRGGGAETLPVDSDHLASLVLGSVCILVTWDALKSMNVPSLPIFLSQKFICKSHFSFIESSTEIWRKQWQPTPVLLPGKSHGRRSLVGCSPWARQESDMSKRLHFHFSLSCIGEGNGNPLQCSCLENPRDRRAWWAAVHGVAQSRTRLK